MDKEMMIDQVQQIMMMLACRDLDEWEKEQMARTVERFVQEEVEPLSIPQILDRMITPMDAQEWFRSYYCRQLRSHCCPGELDEGQDACCWQ